MQQEASTQDASPTGGHMRPGNRLGQWKLLLHLGCLTCSGQQTSQDSRRVCVLCLIGATGRHV